MLKNDDQFENLSKIVKKSFHIGGQGETKEATRCEDKKEQPVFTDSAENGSKDGGPIRFKFIEAGTFYVYFWNTVLEQFQNEDGAEIHSNMAPGMNKN